MNSEAGGRSQESGVFPPSLRDPACRQAGLRLNKNTKGAEEF